MTPLQGKPDTVTIELLGVARLLACRESVELVVPHPLPAREVLRLLANELPALVGTVLDPAGAPLGGHLLSRCDAELLRDPETLIAPGDALLLLSTSAGG